MNPLLLPLLLLSTSLAQLLDPRSHIFNSLSSSLRQWGNTLNPNGASFVPGLIRAGTAMYHARIWPSDPGTPEWLAFDAEMSFGIFGNRMRFPWQNTTTDTWMRTYSAKRDIRVGYFDGMSAMIANTGTFDFVDLVGFGVEGTPGDWTGAWDEYRRAGKLCNWTREYDVPLDGFVRMNAGFELIVCDWQAWELVGNVNVTRTHQDVSEPFYEWARSAAWHNFESEGRVELDWSGLVSAHGRGVRLDPKSSARERRMLGMSNETKETIREEVREVANRPLFGKRGVNWQMVADTVTTRYQPRLLQIQSILSASPNETQLATAGALVHIAVVPYYDPTLADLGLEKCIHGLTWNVNSSDLTREERKLHESVLYVLERICTTLYDLFSLLPNSSPYPTLRTSTNSSIADAQALVTTLFQDLLWPTFQVCPPGACQESEGAFCSLAVWPIIWGGQGQEWPRCLTRGDFDFRNRRPGGGGPGGGGRKRPDRGPGGGRPGGGPPGGPGGPVIPEEKPQAPDPPREHEQVIFTASDQSMDADDWVWWPEHFELQAMTLY